MEFLQNGNDTNTNIVPNAQERAVGIIAFASPNTPGFRCTIKQRYTDFLVNEILPSGQVLHLLNLGNDIGKNAKGKSKQAQNDDGGEAAAEANGDEGQVQPSVKRKASNAGDEDVSERDEESRKKPKLDQPGDEGNAAKGTTDDGENELSKHDRLREIESTISDPDKSSLCELFGLDITNRIITLYAHVILYPDRKPRDHHQIQTQIIPEKLKRTEAHVAVRRIFDAKLETSTLQDLPGVMLIKAAPNKKPTGARDQARDENGAYQKGKLGWSELGGEYLHFTLYKENKDTMEVLYYIASALKVPVKDFQFAGTKDRRAVTVQRVAIFRIHAHRIAEMNKTARGWRIGDFEYKTHGLELGELGGNEFLLTLRDCSFVGDASLVHAQKLELAQAVVQHATNSFQKHGYINYYGLQRFGSFTTGTHIVGQKILSGDLEGAINSILAYSEDLLDTETIEAEGKLIPQDDIARAQAIRLWQDGKPSEASRKMPKRFQAESSIVQHLGRKNRKTGERLQDRDWQGALMAIPRNLRLMYVHAYQSFIWNNAAGKRWEKFGSAVVEGDLVIIGEKDGANSETQAEVDEDGEPIIHPAENDSAPSADDTFTRARPLSKEEAQSGTYNIFDIVLPLPGYDVLYPSNNIGAFYEEFMATDSNGKMDPHNMRRAWKDISLSGAYRKVMARPGGGLEFEVRSYVAEEEQMVSTDLEKIQVAGGDAKYVNGNSDQKGQMAESKEKKIAVILKLQLGSSQYATMALRELTKGGAVHYTPDYSVR